MTRCYTYPLIIIIIIIMRQLIVCEISVTSAKDVMFYPVSVCLSVCLSVSNFTLKNY